MEQFDEKAVPAEEEDKEGLKVPPFTGGFNARGEWISEDEEKEILEKGPEQE